VSYQVVCGILTLHVARAGLPLLERLYNGPRRPDQAGLGQPHNQHATPSLRRPSRPLEDIPPAHHGAYPRGGHPPLHPIFESGLTQQGFHPCASSQQMEQHRSRRRLSRQRYSCSRINTMGPNHAVLPGHAWPAGPCTRPIRVCQALLVLNSPLLRCAVYELSIPTCTLWCKLFTLTTQLHVVLDVVVLDILFVTCFVVSQIVSYGTLHKYQVQILD
jgi:hypothetical protein